MTLHVTSEVSGSPEALTSDSTAELLFTCMGFRVLHEILLVSKSSVAVRAAEVFLSTVASCVR